MRRFALLLPFAFAACVEEAAPPGGTCGAAAHLAHGRREAQHQPHAGDDRGGRETRDSPQEGKTPLTRASN